MLLKKLADSSGMPLQLLNELIQIFDEFILMKHKFHRLHQPVRLTGIKIPQIVLIILIQPLEILLQKIPPLIHLFQRSLLHTLRFFQASFQPYKEIGGKISGFQKQIFQPHRHSLNFHRVF